MNEYKYKDILVKGITIGGVETCYILPQFNIAFDAGRCPKELVDISRLFLTHGHLDHASGLPYYVSQRSLRKLTPPEIFLPTELASSVRNILDIWNKIEGYEAKSSIIPVTCDETIDVRKNYYIQAVPAYHRVTCYGLLLKSYV